MSDSIPAAGFLGRWWSLAAYILRWALAAIFLIAAWTKLQNFAGVPGLRGIDTFAEAIMAYRLSLPDWLVSFSAYAIPAAEVLVAVALILGLWTRAAAIIYILLMAAFLGGILSVLNRGLVITCGCFGDFKLYCEGAIGWCKVYENLTLAGLAGLLVLFGPGRMSMDWVARRS